MHHYQRAQSDIANYVLVYRGEKLAVIEAKKRGLPDTKGLGQAKKYAEKLQTRFAHQRASESFCHTVVYSENKAEGRRDKDFHFFVLN